MTPLSSIAMSGMTGASASGLPLNMESLQGPSATTASMNDTDKQKLKTAATQLEAVFTGYLMEEFNKGLPGAGDSFSSQVYADMFKQSIAQKVAESDSGKGLANQIYQNTLRMSGVKTAPEPHPNPAPFATESVAQPS
jgi:Rod binding domain-containing protein